MTWPTKPLGSMVRGGELSYGIVQPGEDVSGGVPIVRVKDLRRGRIEMTDPLRVAPEISEKHGRTVLEGGELLVSIVGTVGEAAVAPEALGGWNVARAIAVVRPVGVTSRWIQLCLQTPAVRAHFHSMLNTTVQSTLNLADLKRLLIPVPPDAERQGIEEVLGALDDKIAANASLIQTANELAGSLTRSALTGSKQKLGDIAALTMGSSPPGSSYNESGEGTVFYQGVRDFGVRFPSNRVWTTEPVRMAAPADTLVSVRAPVGRTNLASEPSCIGRGLAAVRSTTDHPMTLFHLLRDTPGAWAPYEAEGTVFGSINKQQLAGLLVGRVDPAQTDALEGHLTRLEERIASALVESDKLVKTRDALLPPLMSGKLKVKDAECVVEGVV